MLIYMTYYAIVCSTPGCDWGGVCWFGADPWADQVCCPHHPGKKQVNGRNRQDDPVWYYRKPIQFDGPQGAYGSHKLHLKGPLLSQ